MSFDGALSASGIHCSIVPSFLCLIATLHRRNIDFKIVFRSFGKDIPHIANEFNLFCIGEHPLTSQFSNDGSRIVLDGSDGRPDRRLKLPQCFAQIVRNAASSVGSTADISGSHVCIMNKDLVRIT